jgi:hypothetical protein
MEISGGYFGGKVMLSLLLGCMTVSICMPTAVHHLHTKRRRYADGQE